jgi:coenzyme F420 hydrogenase subunit beta
VTEESLAPAKRERWVAQWKELFDEVVSTGLCTGYAGCVISCPHDVLGYNHKSGGYKPFHVEEELGPGDCIHGQKGCTTSARACPRFRLWEHEADDHLFARERQQDEVSAILLWAKEEGYIDAALVSFLEGDGSTWKAKPGVAATDEENLAAAGSRYTYSANTLTIDEALERGFEKLALVGMSCQSSVPPVMWTRKVGKIGGFRWSSRHLDMKVMRAGVYVSLLMPRPLDRVEFKPPRWSPWG